jgi:hypothetical protein
MDTDAQTLDPLRLVSVALNPGRHRDLPGQAGASTQKQGVPVLSWRCRHNVVCLIMGVRHQRLDPSIVI